jgi:gluconate 5-dehydrogenase
VSTSLFDLTGRIALVTGSVRGLGLVVARGLGRAGATVVLNGRRLDTLEAAVQQLTAEGIRTSGSCFDVTDQRQIIREVQIIEDRVGPIDILVNNAGIQKRAPIVEMPEATWREVLDVNLTGAFLTAQAVVKGMLERRRGKIINICSLVSEVGRKTISPYTAAKGGLKMLTRSMAVEWAGASIQVNGIGPGYFATEMNTALVENPEFDRWLKARTPAGRWGDPEELVGAAIFLASEASSFITGQIIYVDGGILASL